MELVESVFLSFLSDVHRTDRDLERACLHRIEPDVREVCDGSANSLTIERELDRVGQGERGWQHGGQVHRGRKRKSRMLSSLEPASSKHVGR